MNKENPTQEDKQTRRQAAIKKLRRARKRLTKVLDELDELSLDFDGAWCEFQWPAEMAAWHAREARTQCSALVDRVSTL